MEAKEEPAGDEREDDQSRFYVATFHVHIGCVKAIVWLLWRLIFWGGLFRHMAGGAKEEEMDQRVARDREVSELKNV